MDNQDKNVELIRQEALDALDEFNKELLKFLEFVKEYERNKDDARL